jgi:hypothetical protein
MEVSEGNCLELTEAKSFASISFTKYGINLESILFSIKNSKYSLCNWIGADADCPLF